MPDWGDIVNSRLAPLGLDPQREAEIVAELAAHLEELYEHFRMQGFSEQEAVERALASVPEWAGVSREIHSAECEGDSMNSRTKRFWLPGLTTLMLSHGLLSVMTLAGIRPMFIGSNPHESLVLHSWLLVLPVAAGIGAFWSKRAGGGRLARLAAGLFPVLMISAVLVLVLPLARILDRPVPPAMQLSAFAFAMLNGVLVPGIALLLGTLPFLRDSSGKSLDGSARVASKKGKDSTAKYHLMWFLGLETSRRGMVGA